MIRSLDGGVVLLPGVSPFVCAVGCQARDSFCTEDAGGPRWATEKDAVLSDEVPETIFEAWCVEIEQQADWDKLCHNEMKASIPVQAPTGGPKKPCHDDGAMAHTLSDNIWPTLKYGFNGGAGTETGCRTRGQCHLRPCLIEPGRLDTVCQTVGAATDSTGP